MTHRIVSILANGPGCEVPRAPHDDIFWVDNRDNRRSPAQCYQDGVDYLQSDVLVYVHDDVTIHDVRWLQRIMTVFHLHPECDVVGLGGAPRLGSVDLYKRPYRLEQMAREGYVSNQTDWQTHGGKEQGTRRVAVVDAFCMAVRRSFFAHCGWPTAHLTHHCLDLWLACEAARRGRTVYMVGASCTHWGGGTSTKPAYEAAAWLQGGSTHEDHIRPHRWLYEEYRDVLPLDVEGRR